MLSLLKRVCSHIWTSHDSVQWHAQFHGQDGLGDVPETQPALASISHEPLQGIAALKLIEVNMGIDALNQLP